MTKGLLTIALAAAGVASTARAAEMVVMPAAPVSVGGGLYQYALYLQDVGGSTPAVDPWSYGLKFTSSVIQQVAAFGGAVAVDKRSEAAVFDANPAAGYDKDLDSWYNDADFALALPNAQHPTNGSGWIQSGTDTLYAAFGTAGGVDKPETVFLGQIVAGETLNYVGALAYDGGPQVSVAGSFSASIATPGDANGDGKVDVTDLGILATNWQQAGDLSRGDFNGDGFVDVTDLGILATNWQHGVGELQGSLAALGMGGVSVPEPVGTGLLLGATLLAASRRRRATC